MSSTSELVSRREAMKAIGAGSIAATTGCLGASTAENELQSQLSSVEEATSQYADPKTALDEGFTVMGPYVPGMGWHFNHPERTEEIVENGFDIETPNLLTYVQTDSGLQLGSVEWGAPVEAVPENPDLFADENADATEKWHVHEAATHVFAVPDDERTKPSDVPPKQWLTNDHWAEFRPPDGDLEPGDEVSLHWGSLEAKEGEKSERVVDLAITHPDLRTLHAWVHTENPDGVFSPMNPEFSNGGHDH